MRILQINNCHYPRGGADVVYLNTGELLEKAGHQVAYLSTNDEQNIKRNDQEYFVKKINYRDANIFSKISNTPKYIYNKDARNLVSSVVKKFRPDVAHIHLFYGGLTVSILKELKRLKIPSVQTVHDYRLICPAKLFLNNNHEVCEKCKGKSFWHCISNKCSDGSFLQSSIITTEAYYWNYMMNPIELIDYFIFVSKFSRNKHIEYIKELERKSTSLYNFHTHQNRNNSFDRGDYILFYGRLSKEKGLNTLLQACENSNIFLKIAGSGPMQKIVEEYSKKNKNIEYVGFQSGQSLQDLIMKSSYVVVPSECYENNPMSIVEAYSLGKPVIGSRIGGIPELIQDDINGFSFPYGDPFSLKSTINNALRTNEKKYLMLSQNALKFANLNFNKETKLKELTKIYSMVLNA